MLLVVSKDLFWEFGFSSFPKQEISVDNTGIGNISEKLAHSDIHSKITILSLADHFNFLTLTTVWRWPVCILKFQGVGSGGI